MISRFLCTETSVSLVYSYFGDFVKKTVDCPLWLLQLYRYCGEFAKKTVQRPFRFCGRNVILENSRKKRYSARFDFAVVQLFWRIREKNGTVSILIFQSYSYFGEFAKKTVQSPF